MKFIQSVFAQFRSFSRPARLFLIATIIDGIVYSAWFLFFNFYIIERGFSRDFLGIVNAMPAFAMLVLGIPLGLLSDRIGRKRAMVLGVAVSMVAWALQVTLLSQAAILAAAFLAGASSGLYFLSQAPFMLKVSTPENRTMLFSLNFGFVTLAGSVGSLFAGQLPALFGKLLGVPPESAAAYQAVLLFSVGLSTFTLIPLLMIREPSPGPQAAGDRKTTVAPGRRLAGGKLRQTLSQPVVWKISLPNLCIGFGAAILIPYMNLFLKERFGLSDSALGALFSLSALLTGIGSMIAPRLASNLGSKIRAVVLSQGLSLGFLLLLGFSPVASLAALAFLLRGVLMNLSVPLYSSFSMEQVPESQAGTVNSVKELAWQMGWAVGPYLSGVIQASAGFTPLFVITAAMYSLSIILTWVFFGKSEAAGVRQAVSFQAEATGGNPKGLVEPQDGQE